MLCTAIFPSQKLLPNFFKKFYPILHWIDSFAGTFAGSWNLTENHNVNFSLQINYNSFLKHNQFGIAQIPLRRYNNSIEWNNIEICSNIVIDINNTNTEAFQTFF